MFARAAARIAVIPSHLSQLRRPLARRSLAVRARGPAASTHACSAGIAVSAVRTLRRRPAWGFSEVAHHRAQAVARVQQLDGIVSLVDAVENLADVVVNGDFALQRALDEVGHVLARLPAAEGGAHPLAPRYQLEWSRGDLLARRRHTDYARLAPAAVRALERGAHHLDIAGAVERVVHAPLGHAHDHLLHGFATTVARVDEVSRTKRGRGGELLGVNVHRDDAAGTRHARCLDDRQADSAQAEDGHRRAQLHLARVPHGAQAGRYAAAEETGLFKGHRRVDLGARDRRQHAVLGHGATAHEVVQLRAVGRHGEAAGSIGHEPLPLCGADCGAEVGLGALAEDALRRGALRRIARDNVVARRDAGDTLAHALDHSARLVAQDAWEEALRIVAIQRVDIGVAQRVGHHLDTHLARLGRRHHDLLGLERLLGAPCHRRVALDGFALRCLELVGYCRGCRRARHCGGAPRSRLLRRCALRHRCSQAVGVPVDVLLHERADEEVRVVKARVRAQSEPLPRSRRSSTKRFGLQLVDLAHQKAVGAAHIH
mmetsp:Transcript_8509/g.26329  ORF Transcript_8509/g.26329 Transcript_8509/m.26329 type:complete len:544 (-) Transcript_8509:763-2394(-)